LSLTSLFWNKNGTDIRNHKADNLIGDSAYAQQIPFDADDYKCHQKNVLAIKRQLFLLENIMNSFLL